MPVNNQSTGRDCTLDVFDPRTGDTLTITGVKSFQATPQTKNEMRPRITGAHVPFLIPTGWEGEISLDRTDSTVDSWWAAYEAAYYAGENIRGGTIRQTVLEADGARSQYRFEEVALRLTEAGTYAGDAVTEMTMAFQASRRVKVG